MCLANNIDLESNSIDAIASIQTFEYIDDIDEALVEIKKALKAKVKIFKYIYSLGLLSISRSRNKAK